MAPGSTEARKALALKHEMDSERAPSVVAKGAGMVADEILRLAREHNIPIRQDRNLIEILYRMDLESQIPPELYLVVAEMLAFLYLSTHQYQEETAQAFGNLGTVLYTRGDYETARRHWETARNLYNKMGQADKVSQLDLLLDHLPKQKPAGDENAEDKKSGSGFGKVNTGS